MCARNGSLGDQCRSRQPSHVRRVCFTAYAAGRTCRYYGYPVIAWLCWVPNLLVAQVLVRSARGRADF